MVPPVRGTHSNKENLFEKRVSIPPSHRTTHQPIEAPQPDFLEQHPGQCGTPRERQMVKVTQLPGMEHLSGPIRSVTDEDEMSYGDTRSGIVFAIATTFVIAGSTSSHAVPPQAITEEVKSCKAIPNDQQRLKCFDSLFADKPNQTKPLEKSANEDNWSIEESKSSMDGSQQIVAANLVRRYGTDLAVQRPNRRSSVPHKVQLSR